jgi:hypothetical protein
VQNDIFNFAITKLTGAPLQTEKYSDEAEFAILSIRFLLDVESTRRALSPLEGILVEIHMRVAFSVGEHRGYVHSRAPSEPVLVEAAARIMHGDADSMNEIPRRILHHIQKGNVDKGEHGEIVGRLILQLAIDSVSLSTQRDVLWNERVLSNPVLFAEFLLHLFGREISAKVLDSTPANVSNGVKLGDLCDGAKIHVTHFSRAKDSSVLTDSALWMGMSRGTAWQCSRTQEGIDEIFGILRKGHPLGSRGIIPFAVQIKNILSRVNVKVDMEKLGFFSPGAALDENNNLKPYIVLTMQLGVQPRQSTQGQAQQAPQTPVKKRGSTFSFASIARKALPGTPSKVEIPQREGKPTRASAKVHPRYDINAVGCSPSIYAVVRNKDTFANLLSSRPLFSEHCRQGEEHLAAIRH